MGLVRVFSLVLKDNSDNYPICTVEGLQFWGFKDEKALKLLALQEPLGWRGEGTETSTNITVSRISALQRSTRHPASPRRTGVKVRGRLVHSRSLDRLRGGEGTQTET